jgi:hypothetical protein
MMLIVSLVDIAGCFFVFATFRVITHVLFFDGAINREALMEQGPDSDHVFLPLEILRTNPLRRVFEFLETTVFSTRNPGRAAMAGDAELVPSDVWAATVNKYSLPFTRPCTTQPVCTVVQTLTPSEFVTRYVTGSALLTLFQENVSALLATTNDVAVGVAGGTGASGVTTALAAPLPLAFEATVEMT